VRWWTARSLRTTIFVAFSSLILIVLLGTLGVTQFVVGREAVLALSADLRTTGQVFVSLLAERSLRLQTNSTLLAGDFALKRVYATHFDPASYDAETLASAGLSYRERLGVQLVWMTDEAGKLLAASPTRDPAGQSLADFSPLKEALQSQSAAGGLVEVDGKLMQMVAVPVLGPEVIGYLLLGQIVDDSVAVRLKLDTRSDITFLTASHAYASSWTLPPTERGRVAAAQLATLLHGENARNPAVSEIGKRRYLSLVIPIDAHLSAPLYALIQGSYDEALAPLHALQWRISTIGILALAGALLTGMLLAGSITGPVRLLVEAMREVLRGNLHRRAHLERRDELGFLARSFNEMVGGLEDRERIKDTFGRFVSRDVAAAVLDGRVPLAGDRLEVSILFQDIRGFSVLAEALDPAALLRVLNRFFTEVVAAVEAEGGVVKQFTGDGVMALFGAPQVRPDHVERSAHAALAIVERLERVNILLEADGVPPLQIGIGIHTGVVIAGLIGPDERVEYGVVGEPVNLASRIEALTKDVMATILVSREVAMRLGPEFVLGRAAVLPVKGKAQPVEVVELVSCS
jgi:adenylate cyclase